MFSKATIVCLASVVIAAPSYGYDAPAPAPVAPKYVEPVTPKYEAPAPVTPKYDAPAPKYEAPAPVTPKYEAPAPVTPKYEAPAPKYEAPVTPKYEAPAPKYEAPAPVTPKYDGAPAPYVATTAIATATATPVGYTTPEVYAQATDSASYNSAVVQTPGPAYGQATQAATYGNVYNSANSNSMFAATVIAAVVPFLL
ncbi:hypothetical protein BC833DRAFT_567446 [Globomyces pollinis-pini]|nr:hypothetical protein BC833DRAFT_567446 [Globomyces pollinis-pini]